MMTLIGRLLMFALAVLFACDAVTPVHTVIETVDGHTTTTHWRHQTDYDLRFTGGDVRRCNVGWTAYDALKDGDEVTLTASRVFKSCRGIARGDEIVTRPGAGKWMELVFAAFLLAGAFGWIDLRPGDDDRDDDRYGRDGRYRRDDRGGWWSLLWWLRP